MHRCTVRGCATVAFHAPLSFFLSAANSQKTLWGSSHREACLPATAFPSTGRSKLAHLRSRHNSRRRIFALPDRAFCGISSLTCRDALRHTKSLTELAAWLKTSSDAFAETTAWISRNRVQR